MKSTAEVIVAASVALLGGEAQTFASAISLLGDDGQVKEHFRVLPYGRVTLRDGRGPIEVTDQAHGQRVVEATKSYAGAQDLPIDYDHQTVFSAVEGVGGTAKAAGWVKDITAEADGIYFRVEWTPAARAALQAKEYRYISPLFGHLKTSGLVTRLFNAGLTNTPAFDGLGAIAAQVQTQGKSMDLNQLAALYGLPATATIAEILAAANAAKTAASKAGDDLTAANAALSEVRTALGQPDDATTEALVAAATTRKPDPSVFAPMSMVTGLQQQIATLTSKNVAEIVAAATAAGKVAPAPEQQAWALDYAAKDLAGFERFVAAATAIVMPGLKPKPNAVPTGSVADLTAEDRQAAAFAGVSLEDYLASKKEMAQ